MAERTVILWPSLCATWTLLWLLTPAQGSSVSPIFLRTTALPAGGNKNNSTVTPTTNYTDVTCVSLLPPHRGFFSVDKGTGVSVGTVVTFWCHKGFQVVGSEKISCVLQGGSPHWSNHLPVCEAIPRPEDRGLRMAVLASVVSGIIIFTMSVSFIICCLQERTNKERSEQGKDRSRRRGKPQSCHRTEGWLEREERDWDAFPSKIYHLSQCLDPQSHFGSSQYTIGHSGYENRGYQSSQESLMNVSSPGLYHAESQVFPNVVLQRVPTPTAPTMPTAPSAPMYYHLSTHPLTDSLPGQPLLLPFHKTPYNTSGITPKDLWPK